MSEAALEQHEDVLITPVGVMVYIAPRAGLMSDDQVEKLRAAATECLERRDTQLVVDLTTVPSICSAGLETLLDLQDDAVGRGGWLKLVNPNPVLLDTLRVNRLTDTIVIMESPLDEDLQPAAEPRRLGDILLDKGLISKAQIEEALEIQKTSSRRLGQIIIDNKWAPEAEVLQALGQQLSVPYLRLRPGVFDPEVAHSLEKSTALRLCVMPLFSVRGVLSLATTDPQALPVFDEVSQKLGVRVQPVLARRDEIIAHLGEQHGGNSDPLTLLDDLDDDFEVIENLLPEDYTHIDEQAEGSPVINLVNSLIQRAVREGASDIHIEPSRSIARVRFRIDGLLYEITTLRPDLLPALTSRLKVMANLDIAERRLPQDGRIQVQTQGRSVDLRFSSLPGLYGEKVVLRVLDKNQALLDVGKLGMATDNLSAFKALLQHSHGLMLVTGPTGSGKTTTLYAGLNHMNSIEKNIVTIEDPVEYQLDIINQNEVRESIGLTFSNILKHTLRQDPDVVMVGEIRDHETAEIAVQAALTGHLVLSTLHTNHAVGAITRIIDMGVEPYLLSSALVGVVAQRLVRGVCPACRTTFVPSPDLVKRYGWENAGAIKLAKGRGCAECFDSGYRGRFGIHEVLMTDDGLQRLITQNPTREDLSRYLAETDFHDMFSDGMYHARQGHTTIEEVSRVVNS